MAKLVLSTGGSVVYQCFVDKGRLTVGRELHNEIVIDDPAVSREHAAIVAIGNDHILEDLRSANGTIVNGTRVPRRILQHGDVIEFGNFHLRYLNPRTAVEIDPDRTMLITGLFGKRTQARDETGPPATEVRVPAARAARIRLPKGRIKVLTGSDAGRTIELDRVVATVGKPGQQLAVITRRPHGYFVTHVEGRRHPRVNGQSIGREARLLHDRDVIEVGDDRLEFVQD